MTNNLQPVVLAILIGLLTFIVAQMMGVNMGLNEDKIKANYAQISQSIKDTDEAKDAAREAWGETKRAHAHFAGLAPLALIAALIIGFTAVVNWAKIAVSLMISIGAFLYPLSIIIGANNIAKLGEDAGRDSVEMLVILSMILLGGGLIILISYLLLLLIYKDVSKFPKIFERFLVK